MKFLFFLATKVHEGTRRKDEKKISLRFPQTSEATTFFSIHINCKRGLLDWLVQVRKPLDGAYAPSTAPLAEGRRQKIRGNKWI